MIRYARCKHKKPSNECFECPNVEAPMRIPRYGDSHHPRQFTASDVMPPSVYEVEQLDVQIHDGVLRHTFKLPNGQEAAFVSKLPEVKPGMSDERLAAFQNNISTALANTARKLDRLAQTMRKHEQHFNEDDFDELGRIAGQLYQIAERAKS